MWNTFYFTWSYWEEGLCGLWSKVEHPLGTLIYFKLWYQKFSWVTQDVAPVPVVASLDLLICTAQESVNKNLKVLHVFVKAIRAATRVFVSAVWIRVAPLSDRTSLYQTDHSVWNRFNPQAEPLSLWTHPVHSGSSKPRRSPSLSRLSLILFVSGDLKCFAIPLYIFSSSLYL